MLVYEGSLQFLLSPAQWCNAGYGIRCFISAVPSVYGMEGLDWINLAQERDKWLGVETAMNHRASYTTGTFCTS
jgi:hypothetical protein